MEQLTSDISKVTHQMILLNQPEAAQQHTTIAPDVADVHFKDFNKGSYKMQT